MFPTYKSSPLELLTSESPLVQHAAQAAKKRIMDARYPYPEASWEERERDSEIKVAYHRVQEIHRTAGNYVHRVLAHLAEGKPLPVAPTHKQAKLLRPVDIEDLQASVERAVIGYIKHLQEGIEQLPFATEKLPEAPPKTRASDAVSGDESALEALV